MTAARTNTRTPTISGTVMTVVCRPVSTTSHYQSVSLIVHTLCQLLKS